MPLEDHLQLLSPPDDATLWRYMDFTKFLLLLETRSLWFSRVDQFEDPLEGTWTDAELEQLRLQDANNAAPFSQLAKGYQRGSQHMRTTVYVSCWRQAEAESMAMWDLYGKGHGIVALKTRVKDLKDALDESPLRTFLGQVKYVDWSLAPFDNNHLVMCFRKDSSYEHEREVRAAIWDIDVISRNMSDALTAARLRTDYPNSTSDPFMPQKLDGQLGIAVPFDPARFIQEVVIGPRETPMIERLVRSVLDRYGLTIRITVSDRLTPRT